MSVCLTRVGQPHQIILLVDVYHIHDTELDAEADIIWLFDILPFDVFCRILASFVNTKPDVYNSICDMRL